eukprot:Rmarinus@m.20062
MLKRRVRHIGLIPFRCCSIVSDLVDKISDGGSEKLVKSKEQKRIETRIAEIQRSLRATPDFSALPDGSPGSRYRHPNARGSYHHNRDSLLRVAFGEHYSKRNEPKIKQNRMDKRAKSMIEELKQERLQVYGKWYKLPDFEVGDQLKIELWRQPFGPGSTTHFVGTCIRKENHMAHMNRFVLHGQVGGYWIDKSFRYFSPYIKSVEVLHKSQSKHPAIAEHLRSDIQKFGKIK